MKKVKCHSVTGTRTQNNTSKKTRKKELKDSSKTKRNGIIFIITIIMLAIRQCVVLFYNKRLLITESQELSRTQARQYIYPITGGHS